jgi:aryl-alcohol dehydrogenase-like predicted oxidoreductase
MNRREFLGTIGIGLAALPIMASAKPAKLPTRLFGRTGLKVPILGFGSGSRFLMYEEEDRALEALEHAIALGIRYIDTAHAYGNGKSEERIGRLMPSRRKDVILATKIPGRKADQARSEIELSLKRLRTDHLEVLHIHALSDEKDLESIGAKGGVMEALYEAREQKIVRAIGITCHAHPLALKTALERHDFDCVQMALNAGMAHMADTSNGMKATPGETAASKPWLCPSQSETNGSNRHESFWTGATA